MAGAAAVDAGETRLLLFLFVCCLQLQIAPSCKWCGTLHTTRLLKRCLQGASVQVQTLLNCGGVLAGA
jgi:hypothetical protein